MLGRGGSWVGNSVAGLTLGRVWLYQDFVAGSGPNLTITDNDNGTGLGFDSAMLVDNSAVVTKTTGEPIFSNTAELPAQLVSVQSQVGDAVVLDGTPAVGEGVVRVWYLYAMALSSMPVDAELAPIFVKEERSEFLDTRFLNAVLNLSDLDSASTARTNLGFNTVTAGRVLFGDGTSAPISDADLFWDNTNNRLGVNQTAPGVGATLDVGGIAGGIGFPVVTTAERDAITPDRNGVILYNSSLHRFDGYINGAWGAVGITDHGGLSGLADDDHTQYVLLAGRNGGQTIQGDTASGGDLTIKGTAHATPGSIVTPDQVKIYGATGNAGTFGALSVKAKSDTLGQHLQLEGPGTDGNRFLYINQRENGDMFFYNPGLSRVLIDYNAAANSFAIGQTGGNFQFQVTATQTDTTPATPPAIGNMAISNADTTDGNYSGFLFQGSQSGLNPDSAIYGIHDDHNGASSSGSLEFWTRNAGTYARKQRLGVDGVLTLDAYTAGLALFSGSGVVSALTGAAGQVLYSDGTTWVATNRKEKAGKVDIASGATTKAIVFATARADANYTPIFSLLNSTDDDPIGIPVRIIAIANTGFTAEWDDELPTADYDGYWGILEHYDP